MFKSKMLKNQKICLLIVVFLFSLSTFSNAKNTVSYDRRLFGSWKDFDNDCQNTRHELLQKLSRKEFTLSDNNCQVLTGLWLDPYTNDFFINSSELDIDHLVPLKYAWTRGAYNWPKSKRVKFSNDESNLFTVKKNVNRQKSAMGPAMWLPPSDNFKCEYIKSFQRIVAKYNLRQAKDELSKISIKIDKFCVD